MFAYRRTILFFMDYGPDLITNDQVNTETHYSDGGLIIFDPPAIRLQDTIYAVKWNWYAYFPRTVTPINRNNITVQ